MKDENFKKWLENKKFESITDCTPLDRIILEDLLGAGEQFYKSRNSYATSEVFRIAIETTTKYLEEQK